nr:MAG TPA: hypothetical protein [Caudoviricetes sp.]
MARPSGVLWGAIPHPRTVPSYGGYQHSLSL